MGLISGSGQNKFISAEFIYSKIKRQWKSFGSVNLLDEMDFPTYTMDVLRLLGNGAMRESEAVTIINNNQARLPKDFYSLHAAYRCSNFGITRRVTKQFQNKTLFEDDVTCELLCRQNNCDIDCHKDDKLINRVTVKHYINEDLVKYEFGNLGLLNLTPNVRVPYEKNSHHLSIEDNRDITIDNGYIFTNFKDDAIFMQYYAYPFDENEQPMIPDNPETEFAVEWYIKHQLLLNFWLVDDVPNAVNKWQKAEQEASKWLAEARHLNKIPSFSTLVNYLKDVRGINKLQTFSNNNRLS